MLKCFLYVSYPFNIYYIQVFFLLYLFLFPISVPTCSVSCILHNSYSFFVIEVLYPTFYYILVHVYHISYVHVYSCDSTPAMTVPFQATAYYQRRHKLVTVASCLALIFSVFSKNVIYWWVTTRVTRDSKWLVYQKIVKKNFHKYNLCVIQVLGVTYLISNKVYLMKVHCVLSRTFLFWLC